MSQKSRLTSAPKPGVPSLGSVNWDDYDFLDYGSSKGGSIRHCKGRFHATRGVGVDIDPNKVVKARAAGVDAFVGDATELGISKAVRFVSMLDFLEHLPDLTAVKAAIASAAEVATDFIYIKHPSFEGEELVESLGVRQYWWHWRGHTCHIHVSDYCAMFDDLGLHQYMIRHHVSISDSSHPSVIRTGLRPDIRGREAAARTDTPFIEFERPIWRRQDIFIALRPFDPDEWRGITRRFGKESIGPSAGG